MYFNKLKISVLLLCFFFLPARAENTGADEIIVVNPPQKNSCSTYTGGLYFADYETLSDYAQAGGKELIDDMGPVADRKAFFLENYRALFSISGLSRYKIYRIAVDFVRYRGHGGGRKRSVSIYASLPGGTAEFIAAADPDSIGEQKLFEAEIPYSLSYGGEIDILVSENSGKTGGSGIWDIIIYAGKGKKEP